METKYGDITDKVGVIVNRDYPSTTAQTASNYGYIACLPFPFEILKVIEKHDVAGTNGGAVTLDVLKVPNGTTLASGSSILNVLFNLKSTADTAVLKQGLDLNNQRSFDPLDSIALKVNGTLTSLEGVQVTIYIKPLNRGEFR